MSGQTERVGANLVSGNFFEVLGAQMILGRPIVLDDARVVGANPVAVLSHGFWRQRFGADPAILNRQVLINGQSLTVIGVAAPGFDGVAMGERAWPFIRPA